MKKFLIEFFRPIDNILFNYLVRIGGIQPFISALIGAGAKFLGSGIGKQVLGNVIGGGISSLFTKKGGGSGAGGAGGQGFQMRPITELFDESLDVYSPERLNRLYNIKDMMLGQDLGFKTRQLEQTTPILTQLGEQQLGFGLGLMDKYGDRVRDTFTSPNQQALIEGAMSDLETAQNLPQFEIDRIGTQGAYGGVGASRGMAGLTGTLGAVQGAFGRAGAMRDNLNFLGSMRSNASNILSANEYNPANYIMKNMPNMLGFGGQILGDINQPDPMQLVNTQAKIDAGNAELAMNQAYLAQKAREAKDESTSNLIGKVVPQVFDFFDKGGITGDKETSIFGG